jgi:PAS domain S-box-containing protein
MGNKTTKSNMADIGTTHIENSNHFEALFSYALMGILVTDSKGKITAINPFALKEFGYTEKELIGENVEKLIPSRFHASHSHYYEGFQTGTQSRRMGSGRDLFAVKKDGTEFPAEISLSNYMTNGNSYTICIITDISIRKKAEKIIITLHDELESIVEQRTSELKNVLQELEKTNGTLDNAISFQKAILDNAGAMIIATDENGIIKFFNPEASLNIGYHGSEVINKKTPLLFHDKNEIAAKKKELANEFGIIVKDDFAVLVEKARRNIHEEEQYTCIRKNGTTFPISLTITCIRNNEHVITGFLGIAIDISERKKAENILRKSLEKEKELGELKSRFVSMASHEFRTPLSTILSSAYLIEKYIGSEDQPKREKHLQRVVTSVTLLTDILNDFLSVGKIEEGKIQVKPTMLNIHELVLATVRDLKVNLKNHQKIQYHHEGNKEVLLDVSLLKHILMNLVSNASKFSPEGSPIEIKTINQNQHLILSVKDYGIGIAKEDQKHLMERFFRGANAGPIQGTGLGLHIVSKYAELMNGTVECKSELEKGTEFIIKFTSKTN